MINKKWKFSIQIILIIIISYICSFLFFNFNLLSNIKSIGNKNMNNNIIEMNDINRKDGKYITTSNNASITFKVDASYTDKFMFNYNTEDNFNWNIVYNKKDYYGKFEQDTITGIASNKINLFSKKIDNETNQITININSENVELTNFSIMNSISYFSTSIFIIILCSVGLYLLIYFRKFFSKNLEYAFALISIILGLSIILSMPIAIETSWDDETHFLNEYGLLNDYHTEATLELYQITETNYGMFNTKEEQKEYIAHLNSLDKINTESKTDVRWAYNKVIYIPQALVIKVGKIINLNISTIFVLGKLTTLLIYITIVFFAIRKIPKCKYLILTIALLPTSIFLASNYSYDPPVTALIMLGMAYFYYEYTSKEKKYNKKNIIISILSFILASSTKTIYIPLILILLLLPTSKFNNKKHRTKFSIALIIIFVLMMATFILPTVSGNSTGDPRGGDTSVSRQLSLVISQPLSFSKVVIDNLVISGSDKVIGEGGITSYAYFGNIKDKNIYYILLLLLFFAINIENTNENEKLKKLKLKEKIFGVVLIISIYCMIWASMFLIFTPVGSTIIYGVQNRYFLPIIFPLLFVLNADKIKVNFNKINVYCVYIISLLIINIYSIMSMISI